MNRYVVIASAVVIVAMMVAALAVIFLVSGLSMSAEHNRRLREEQIMLDGNVSYCAGLLDNYHRRAEYSENETKRLNRTAAILHSQVRILQERNYLLEGENLRLNITLSTTLTTSSTTSTTQMHLDASSGQLICWGNITQCVNNTKGSWCMTQLAPLDCGVLS